jgi:hypothetical protein
MLGIRMVLNFRTSWYLYVGLAFLIVVGVQLRAYALSPFAGSAVTWYSGSWSIAIGLFIVSWIVYTLTKPVNGEGISIMPMGHFSPSTYPVQRLFGYTGSAVIALIAGLGIAGLLSYFIINLNVTFVPVIQLLTPGFQAPLGIASFLFSTTNSVSLGLANSLPATFIENPLFMMALMPVTWLPARFILKQIGVPSDFANWIGLATWVVVASFAFPFIFHFFSFQNVEVAYMRAFIFASLTATATGLTGFPIPMDIAHFTNNFVAILFKITQFGVVMVVPPLLFGVVLPKLNINIFGGKK